jgi:hypothetical protein
VVPGTPTMNLIPNLSSYSPRLAYNSSVIVCVTFHMLYCSSIPNRIFAVIPKTWRTRRAVRPLSCSAVPERTAGAAVSDEEPDHADDPGRGARRGTAGGARARRGGRAGEWEMAVFLLSKRDAPVYSHSYALATRIRPGTVGCEHGRGRRRRARERRRRPPGTQA